ncbi:MAG: DUF2259 domain-containing protein [Cohaesibacteraceae bacterium]|nr:DUF2259 domain-containing protein [Cohaesibacteraceae bacterium]
MRALFKKLIVILALPLIFNGGSIAGDYAEHRILGFSEDGRFFGFEEYGIQDGSGFPYSNIYVIDLARDSWVKNTPVRITLTSENKTLLEARHEAMKGASDVLINKRLVVPGALLGANPVNSVRDGQTLAFFRDAIGGKRLQHGSVQLSQFKLPLSDQCASFGVEAVRGFRLSFSDQSSGQIKVLHQDAKLPSSRGCAISYRLSALYAHTRYPDMNNGVAIISVFKHGFEGPDRRFIAVPVPLRLD